MPDIFSILADILYRVEAFHLSLDSAFRQTCETIGCRTREVDKEVMYRIARDFISKYYLLVELMKSKKHRYSRKELARLYLVLYGKKYKVRVPSRISKKYRDLIVLTSKFNYEKYPWVELSYPKWFYDHISKVLGGYDALELLKALNNRTIWLRVNTLKIDVDKAIKLLEKENIVVEKDKDLWYMLRVINSPYSLHKVEAIRNYFVIPQDKASALVVEALKPSPDMLIYDLTAAPGMKTSLIMQLTENKAHIVAFDVSKKRLKTMKYLMKNLGVDFSRIDIVLIDSRILHMRRKADAVLLDAPCSSSGAIPKDPAIKIHLHRKGKIEYYTKLQKELLSIGLKLCSDKLIYATCSIFPEEGEEIIEKFVDLGIAKVVKPSIIGAPGYVKYRIAPLVKRLLPHIHMTEGFFISQLCPI